MRLVAAQQQTGHIPQITQPAACMLTCWFKCCAVSLNLVAPPLQLLTSTARNCPCRCTGVMLASTSSIQVYISGGRRLPH